MKYIWFDIMYGGQASCNHELLCASPQEFIDAMTHAMDVTVFNVEKSYDDLLCWSMELYWHVTARKNVHFSSTYGNVTRFVTCDIIPPYNDKRPTFYDFRKECINRIVQAANEIDFDTTPSDSDSDLDDPYVIIKEEEEKFVSDYDLRGSWGVMLKTPKPDQRALEPGMVFVGKRPIDEY